MPSADLLGTPPQMKKNGKKSSTPLESFSFNFRLNAGIHGKSNIGVKVR